MGCSWHVRSALIISMDYSGNDKYDYDINVTFNRDDKV